MKKQAICGIVLLSLIFTIGCTQKNESPFLYGDCICDDCIRINLADYEGGYMFYNDFPIKIGTEDFSIPIGSQITVCKERNNLSGDCEQELFKFRIVGRC